jgi:hypothetical protein
MSETVEDMLAKLAIDWVVELSAGSDKERWCVQIMPRRPRRGDAVEQPIYHYYGTLRQVVTRAVHGDKPDTWKADW